MDLGLQGKTALVMSSSRGLGEGLARSLADEGVHVLITGRTETQLNQIVHDLVTKARTRCSENGRKTVRATDF